MPSDPDLDKRLKDFLAFQEEERSEGVTLKSMAGALRTVVDRLGDHERKDEGLHKEVQGTITSHDRRIVSLEKDVEHLNKDVDRVEQSGSHNVPEILQAASRLSRPKSDPPKSGLSRALATETAKNIAKGVLILVVWAFGWLAHHIQLTWHGEPSSSSQEHR